MDKQTDFLLRAESFTYLRGSRFLWRWVRWRKITQAEFLNGVRPTFRNCSDDDILLVFHFSNGNVVHINGRYMYRCFRKGAS